MEKKRQTCLDCKSTGASSRSGFVLVFTYWLQNRTVALWNPSKCVSRVVSLHLYGYKVIPFPTFTTADTMELVV